MNKNVKQAEAFNIFNGVISFGLILGWGYLEVVIWPFTDSATHHLRFVALAAFAAGGLVGFVFGADGVEEKTFTPIAGIINGVLGGSHSPT